MNKIIISDLKNQKSPKKEELSIQKAKEKPKSSP
jgi:hypothetical protein